MDLEADLIRSQDWTGLKRFYSSQLGHAWELGWIQLLQYQDKPKALSQFGLTVRDPRYEAASYIMLWKLGKKPASQPLTLPASLYLYEAYLSGSFDLLLRFIKQSPENERYAPLLLGESVSSATEKDLMAMLSYKRTALLSLAFGQHCDRRLKIPALAEKFYAEFISDPWSQRVLQENRRYIFDSELIQKLCYAYSKKDPVLVTRLLRAAAARIDKLPMSSMWKAALKKALDWEISRAAENILSYPVWKSVEFSPQAIQIVRESMFSLEPLEEPPFVQEWERFFESRELDFIPTLDADSLAVWQIRVEIDQGTLSEALLRFPSEERFLFLWSLRQRESTGEYDPRRWPEDAKESGVVRKNLERAFERASNKVLWFDRLRQCGCSQSFYEYALSRASIPLGWVLEDLKKQFLKNTAPVRIYLIDQLSIPVRRQVGVNALSSGELLTGLSYLTPAEAQNVLLTRFSIVDIPEEILDDNYIDLFWDARSRVSGDLAQKWEAAVLRYLSKKSRTELTARHWQWIQDAWEKSILELERFAPSLQSGAEFPWASYLETLQRHELRDLLLTCLPRVPDDRLKERWIRDLMEVSSDNRILSAIQSLTTDYMKNSLLADWHEKSESFETAMTYRELEFEQCPILNEQVRIARALLKLHEKTPRAASVKKLDGILSLARFLEANGYLDTALCREIAHLYSSFGEWEQAWKWLTQAWVRSSDFDKEELFEVLIDTAFKGRIIEATQRFLIHYLLEKGAPNTMTHRILDVLLNRESIFRVQHLRSELVDRAGCFFPLHRDVLEARAAYDYRAFILWECFYREKIDHVAPVPSYPKKRKYELWGLTNTATSMEAGVFARYIETMPVEKTQSAAHEFLDQARRTMARLAKHYGHKKSLDLVIRNDLDMPFRISFEPALLEVHSHFFETLDEELWIAMTTGFLQVLEDREKGLFEPKRLMERFFHGMLLSGVPLSHLIKLWVRLALQEGLVEQGVLKGAPEEIMQRLPFINALLIFYLSPDFSQKMEDCAFIPV